MSFFSHFKLKSAEGRLVEEQLYERVVNELTSGIKREGIWAKAVAKSYGNEAKAKSLYIKFRVQSLKDEIEVEKASKRATVDTQGSNTNELLDMSLYEGQITREKNFYKYRGLLYDSAEDAIEAFNRDQKS